MHATGASHKKTRVSKSCLLLVKLSLISQEIGANFANPSQRAVL